MDWFLEKKDLLRIVEYSDETPLPPTSLTLGEGAEGRVSRLAFDRRTITAKLPRLPLSGLAKMDVETSTAFPKKNARAGQLQPNVRRAVCLEGPRDISATARETRRLSLRCGP
jgi:hypothetical protein